MAAATVEVPAEPTPSFDGRAEATRTTPELFQWSTYVHAGAGAEKCEHGKDGQCQDPEHFHCWLRLPNPFQANDIGEKARAARARRRRALQDKDSDAHLVLEEEIQSWLLADDAWEVLLTRIADRRLIQEQADIRREMDDTDQFEHYASDLEEFQRLSALPEGERDEDEYQQLVAHTTAYAEEFEKRSRAFHEKEMAYLRNLPQQDVLKLERRYRIDEIATEQFLNTYYQWAYYVCALKPVGDGFPSERVFKSPEDLRTAPPEVAQALRDTYRGLEGRTIARGDAAGNS